MFIPKNKRKIIIVISHFINREYTCILCNNYIEFSSIEISIIE